MVILSRVRFDKLKLFTAKYYEHVCAPCSIYFTFMLHPECWLLTKNRRNADIPVLLYLLFTQQEKPLNIDTNIYACILRLPLR